MATVVERPSSISEVVFEDLKSEQDFDDLKTEFCVMYQEIKEKVSVFDLFDNFTMSDGARYFSNRFVENEAI